MNKIKVAFVCHGNICRSPMAQYIFQSLIDNENISDYFYVDSFATSYEEIGNGIYPSARRTLNKHSILGPFTHRAKRITINDYKDFDYILIMDDNNLYNLLRIIGRDDDSKVYKLKNFNSNSGEIEDPWYTDNFEKVYIEIEKGCKDLLKFLKDKYGLGEI